MWVLVLESQIAPWRDMVSQRSVSKWLGSSLRQCPSERPITGLQLSTPRRRSRRRAKWDLEDNTVWDGQEKKKLWVNMAICNCLPSSVCLSHATEALTPLENKECYIFITECYYSIIHHFFLSCVYNTNPLLFICYLLNSATPVRQTRALLEKQRQTHKRHSLMGSCTRKWQCSSTSKNIQISLLFSHKTPTRRPTRSNAW